MPKRPKIKRAKKIMVPAVYCPNDQPSLTVEIPLLLDPVCIPRVGERILVDLEDDSPFDMDIDNQGMETVQLEITEVEWDARVAGVMYPRHITLELPSQHRN